MPSDVKILRVFIASPSDVQLERTAMKEVVAELNILWGEDNSVRLELVGWESNVRPGFGDDAQDVINDQIADNYDIFVGIMWARYGQPTGRADSGTEEEFANAFRRLTKGDPIEILFYFKNAAISPSNVDPEQFTKVCAFKKSLSEEHGGLYHTFESVDDFKSAARIHLSSAAKALISKRQIEIYQKPKFTADSLEIPKFNPLANLEALEDEENEEGVLELLEVGETAISEVTKIVERMSIAVDDLGKKTEKHLADADKLSLQGDVQANWKIGKKLANNSAETLELFVSRMTVEIPEFYKQNMLFADSFSKALMMVDESTVDKSDANTAYNGINKYRLTIETVFDQISHFGKVLRSLPRMTSAFNRAKRRAGAINDDLLSQLRIAINQARDIENSLANLL